MSPARRWSRASADRSSCCQDRASTQPTPNPEFPAVITPRFAGWAHVTPFVLRHGLQFEVEPAALFDLSGPVYAAYYNEVKRAGDARVRGAHPESDESDVARFWPGGGSNWNATTRTIVSGTSLDPWQLGRLFALLNIAQADAAIVNQQWKYTYNFWRPVTAIRWPDDGNPETESDPAWRPFFVTPAFPDSPCALPTLTAAAATVLRDYFGTDGVAFRRGRRSHRREGIFAGIHFREGCEAGARQGTQVARFVTRHSLRPLRDR